MSARFDPHKHKRKSTRYSGWDYRTPGYYFITICTVGRTLLFEEAAIQDVVEAFWRRIPEQKTAGRVVLDAFVVMPNHVHFILRLVDYPVDYVPLAEGATFRAPLAGSIGALIRVYKSDVARGINNVRRTPGQAVWQRGYWDRILRNEHELNATRQYIADNPARWAEDRENFDRLFEKMTFHA